MLTLLLHGSLLLNCMALGYLDILFVPFVITSLFALDRGRYTLFTVLFALAALMKFQPLIIAPFILIHLAGINRIRDFARVDYKKLLQQFVLPAGIILLIMILLYDFAPFHSLRQASKDTFLSGNALNLNWIYSWALHLASPEKFNPLRGGLIEYIIMSNFWVRIVPRTLNLVVYAGLLIVYFRGRRDFSRMLVFSLLAYISYFTFNTGVHENHLVLIFPLFAVLAHFRMEYREQAIVWIILGNVNMLVFYGFTGAESPFNRNLSGMDITLPLAVLIFIVYARFMFVELSNSLRETQNGA